MNSLRSCIHLSNLAPTCLASRFFTFNEKDYSQTMNNCEEQLNIFNQKLEETQAEMEDADPQQPLPSTFSSKDVDILLQNVKAEVNNLRAYAEYARKSNAELENPTCCGPVRKAVYIHGAGSACLAAAEIVGFCLGTLGGSDATKYAGIGVFSLAEGLGFIVSVNDVRTSLNQEQVELVARINKEQITHFEAFEGILTELRDVKELQELFEPHFTAKRKSQVAKKEEVASESSSQNKDPNQDSQAKMADMQSSIEVETSINKYNNNLNDDIVEATSEDRSEAENVNQKLLNATSEKEEGAYYVDMSEQLIDEIDDKMKSLFRGYDNLPSEMKTPESYSLLLSHVIHHLPREHHLKQTLENLVPQDNPANPHHIHLEHSHSGIIPLSPKKYFKSPLNQSQLFSSQSQQEQDGEQGAFQRANTIRNQQSRLQEFNFILQGYGIPEPVFVDAPGGWRIERHSVSRRPSKP